MLFYARALPLLLAAYAVAALQPPSWNELSKTLPSAARDAPAIIDAVHHQSKRPPLEDDTLVLYRERNGWCPYSERVWLGLECKNVKYQTVLIDNTGGGRPSWFGSTTPRICWADGTDQGESLDILKALDECYPSETPLFDEHSAALIGAFKDIFPRMTRPSSRAAFLFRSSGQSVARKDFESTLEKTDALLAEKGGPFFAGTTPTAPDVCWAPFLERYAAQLPLLHDGLRPRDAGRYPHLSRWYDAMESQIPAYGCRVRGDASSWSKVLNQAGHGNAGGVPEICPDGDTAARDAAASARGAETWTAYAADRPWVAPSPEEEAAATILRRHDAIRDDAARRGVLGGNADAISAGLRGVVAGLSDEAHVLALDEDAAAMARDLDERLCCPRDLGAPAAAAIRRLAALYQ